MGCPALELAGHWVELGLSIETEISGRFLTLADWYYLGPGGLWWSSVLHSALSPQRLSPDPWLEHQDAVSRTAVNVAVSIMKSDYKGSTITVQLQQADLEALCLRGSLQQLVAKRVGLHVCCQNLKRLYRGLHWVQSRIWYRWCQEHLTLSRLCAWNCS